MSSKLVELELEGCDKITDISLQALAVYFSGKYGPNDNISNNENTDDEEKEDDNIENSNYSNRSSLKKLWISASKVSPNGVHLITKKCRSLVDIRLDDCIKVLGSFLDVVVANDVWEYQQQLMLQKELKLHLQQKMYSRAGQSNATASARSSRLPVPIKHHRRSSSSRSSSIDSINSRNGPESASDFIESEFLMPKPKNWCRLEGEDAIKRVRMFKGKW